MPDSLYVLAEDAPKIESPVLLYNLNGFIDAGFAGGGVVDHLVADSESTVLARFDTDALVDYRARRPEMRFTNGTFDGYAAPDLSLRLLHDDVGAPFLLLAGPEPDVRWEAFTGAVRGLVERFGVRLTVGFHGIPTPTPHTRPIGVSAYVSRAGLVPDDQVLNMDLRVPGSAGSLLHFRLAEAGHDAVGLVARVPHYLAESEYPQASVSVLRTISAVTGLLLPVTPLLAASEKAEQLVQEQVADNEQVARVVEALETQYDAFDGSDTRGSLIAELKAMPTADELGAEFERYLSEAEPPDDQSP